MVSPFLQLEDVSNLGYVEHTKMIVLESEASLPIAVITHKYNGWSLVSLVVEARDLPLTRLQKKPPNTYVKLVIGDLRETTQIIPRSRAPSWNERFTMCAVSPTRDLPLSPFHPTVQKFKTQPCCPWTCSTDHLGCGNTA